MQIEEGRDYEGKRCDDDEHQTHTPPRANTDDLAQTPCKWTTREHQRFKVVRQRASREVAERHRRPADKLRQGEHPPLHVRHYLTLKDDGGVAVGKGQREVSAENTYPDEPNQRLEPDQSNKGGKTRT